MSRYYIQLSAYGRDWFDERAAILEYDGGFTRQEAEKKAFMEVLLLDKEERDMMRRS